MMKPTLLVLAAGMGSRYGGLKQIDGFGKSNEAILEYSIYDAIRAWFGKVVFVIREEFETAFKEKFKDTFQDQIAVEYVYQNKEITIDGKVYGQDREKPRGTGHAVLVAKDVIKEPFAVINADDYYGVSAYEQIVDYFRGVLTPDICCIIGYILENTLSASGTVNRWVCKVSDDWQLIDVKETLKISKKEDGKITDQDWQEIWSESVVSMNFWWFHHEVFKDLQEAFEKFVLENQDNSTKEFYIPYFVDHMIKQKELVCDVLQSQDAWCGVTYPEDKPAVKQILEWLIAKGVYPDALR